MKTKRKTKDADLTELTPEEKIRARQAGWELCWTFDVTSKRVSLYPYATVGVVQPRMLVDLLTQNARNGDPLCRRAIQLITASLQ
jgi:hypothetical protein